MRANKKELVVRFRAFELSDVFVLRRARAALCLREPELTSETFYVDEFAENVNCRAII